MHASMPGHRSANPADSTWEALIHPGVLAMAAVAVIACGMAFGYLPQHASQFQAFFLSAVHTNPSPGSPTALNSIVYGIAGLAVFFILLALIRLFDTLIRKLSKPAPPLEVRSEPLREAPSTALQTPTQSFAVAATPFESVEPRVPVLLDVNTVARAHDSRSRLAPHFDGLHRRAADSGATPIYSGPYRRATDNSVPTQRPTQPPLAQPAASASHLTRS